jgi:hypothetical protein
MLFNILCPLFSISVAVVEDPSVDSPWFCVLIEKLWPLFDTPDSTVVDMALDERIYDGKGGDVDVRSS